MKTNCELPLCMLNENTILNEYDFVLFHLYTTNETYKNYFLNLRASNPDRLMILDCSAYEYYVKKQELPLWGYIHVIEELQPDYYIMPDVLMNKEKTITDSEDFEEILLARSMQGYNPKGQPLYVVQGKTSDEMIGMLLKYHSEEHKNICIPFHNSFFKSYAGNHLLNKWRLQFGKLTEDMAYAAGRVQWIKDNYNILKFFDYIHLLGSHFPYEKQYYNIEPIKTMDTGYPVKQGYAGYRLYETLNKPNIIIDDMATDISNRQKHLIRNNVNEFRNS